MLEDQEKYKAVFYGFIPVWVEPPDTISGFWLFAVEMLSPFIAPFKGFSWEEYDENYFVYMGKKIWKKIKEQVQ